jgi:alanyl-tRNA synthetase
MKPTNSIEIRQAFLDYFEEMGHEVVPSSPLPIYDNPTLLFTNAGMNQFVNAFLGKEKRANKRAASAQKCMRVQGKHNDLENVGPSPRHHTYFEMLGNFSFGDYFKEGAIQYAYTFITEICEISADKLIYTVHREDDEAYDIWVNKIGVPAERVLRMGDETNFWMMGEVGPCGPTSEIHYDWGAENCSCDEPDCGVALDNDCDRWLEIWNLVFMQFDQAEDGSRTPLPKPGVDTGMGLERLTAVVEQQPINYETDLFGPAMNRIQELLGDNEEERQSHETGYRVIADHSRAATFLIADGVLPGNVGKGYVLRMIIRRAARYGRSIGFTEPFLSEIASVYIDQMGDFYNEIQRHKDHIFQTVTLEEKRFARTLDGALSQLEGIMAELHHDQESVIPGEIAFNLYATHGLPLEITKDVVNERGFEVDEEGYMLARKAHAEASGAGAFGQYETKDDIYGTLLDELISQGYLSTSGVDYDPYSGPRLESEILGIIRNGRLVNNAQVGQEIELVTAATPFYVEAGGEVDDTGTISLAESIGVMKVIGMSQPATGLIIHRGLIEKGDFVAGNRVNLEVDDQRRWDIRRNHTATHILHKELRRHIGSHVTQQGSLVAPDRLRFDFSHGQSVSDDLLAAIEQSINETILSNQPVSIEFMPKVEATRRGAMALFGEKYGDVVRTIRIGDENEPYSFELCGGLHVEATGDIGIFNFTSEEAVGSGLRRVEAVTGRQAYKLVSERRNLLDRLAKRLNSPVVETENKVASILTENKALQKEMIAIRREQAKNQFESLLGRMEDAAGVSFIATEVRGADAEVLREMADWFRDRVDSGVSVLAATNDNRVILVVAVTEDLTKRGLHAGNIVGKVAKILGGGGGGRPTLAQAGGRDVSKLTQALESVPGIIEESLN